ncbi:hypothetical protein AC578_6065 [Pseudocercospora eumusae]|uniref:Uncharacterized protein n=1 Tax=Pseudocercospora eumusae TaxID=321146 RepID=A0A139HVE7_9PEZI|nr:hypothetical protein AC578_6065 [Pseudocercospora eumusae]
MQTKALAESVDRKKSSQPWAPSILWMSKNLLSRGGVAQKLPFKNPLARIYKAESLLGGGTGCEHIGTGRSPRHYYCS